MDGMGRVNETRTRTGCPFPSIDRGVSDFLAPRVSVSHGMMIMPLDKIAMFGYKFEVRVARRSLRRTLVPRLGPPQIGPGLESRHPTVKISIHSIPRNDPETAKEVTLDSGRVREHSANPEGDKPSGLPNPTRVMGDLPHRF
ncbi:hypothetical protein CRG98_024678 [Punica granatum]|uniref:Uncharacterized protein n=1 Tax=Punica granatum TaxID=22663 RepID=A0A2I0JFA5_PUNGR|nr:hypothetical protein CRG98_024678 [Punica granatum]